MSVSISLSEPWTPSLQGNALPPYLELEALSRARPNISHHETWARTTVMAYTEQVPAAEGAIQESVLILWRLHRLFSAEQEPTWQQYTSAWLVSPLVAPLSRDGREVMAKSSTGIGIWSGRAELSTFPPF